MTADQLWLCMLAQVVLLVANVITVIFAMRMRKLANNSNASAAKERAEAKAMMEAAFDVRRQAWELAASPIVVRLVRHSGRPN